MFTVDSTLAKASEGTGDRKIGFTIMSTDDVTDGFVKFILRVYSESVLQNSITWFDTMVSYLSISDQNEIDELIINNGFCDDFRRCSSISYHLIDK